MKVIANARRIGTWWSVDVPELSFGTQAKRLDQIPAMVADAAALMTGQSASDFDVHVRPVIDGVELDALVAELTKARAELKRAESAAAVLNREVVADLRSHELSVRDIATILDISPQRVSVLAS